MLHPWTIIADETAQSLKQDACLGAWLSMRQPDCSKTMTNVHDARIYGMSKTNVLISETMAAGALFAMLDIPYFLRELPVFYTVLKIHERGSC